jgi:hypothetical protein
MPNTDIQQKPQEEDTLEPIGNARSGIRDKRIALAMWAIAAEANRFASEGVSPEDATTNIDNQRPTSNLNDVLIGRGDVVYY